MLETGVAFPIVFLSIVNLLFEMLSLDKTVEALKVLDEFESGEYNAYIR